jgi:hypothetical protein
MRGVVRAVPFLVVALLACGGGSVTPPAAPSSSTLAQPARNIHLRVSFDDDPTTYLGRFIPDAVKDGDVDESAAVVTRCSQFIKPKVVNSNQEMDEVMYVSQKASGSLGVPVIGQASASHETSSALRVSTVAAATSPTSAASATSASSSWAPGRSTSRPATTRRPAAAAPCTA